MQGLRVYHRFDIRYIQRRDHLHHLLMMAHSTLLDQIMHMNLDSKCLACNRAWTIMLHHMDQHNPSVRRSSLCSWELPKCQVPRHHSIPASSNIISMRRDSCQCSVSTYQPTKGMSLGRRTILQWADMTKNRQSHAQVLTDCPC